MFIRLLNFHPSLRWSSTFAWLALTLWLLLTPGSVAGAVVPSGPLHTELVFAIGHVVLFFGLALLWCWTLVSYMEIIQVLPLVMVAGLTLSVILEGVQIFLPERGASMLDLGANVLGVGLCWKILRDRTDGEHGAVL